MLRALPAFMIVLLAVLGCKDEAKPAGPSPAETAELFASLPKNKNELAQLAAPTPEPAPSPIPASPLTYQGPYAWEPRAGGPVAEFLRDCVADCMRKQFQDGDPEGRQAQCEKLVFVSLNKQIGDVAVCMQASGSVEECGRLVAPPSAWMARHDAHQVCPSVSAVPAEGWTLFVVSAAQQVWQNDY